MPQKSPLSIVKESFGGKDKLVDQLVGLLGSSSDEPKDELKKRLLGAPNSKLLRLHKVATTVKDKYGSREKLVDAAAAAVGKAKDKDFVTKLGTYSSARLVGLAGDAAKKAGRIAAKAKRVAELRAAKKAGAGANA